MTEHLQLWPQITVLCMFALAWVKCLYLHGEPVSEPKYDAGKFTFGLVIVIVLLGNGGFWKPLGW